MRREIRLGPGLLVTAAFIGPGTVTTASVAGAQFGFALLWAVVFSVIATLILQEMAARLGVIGRCGLGEALRTAIQHPILRPGLAFLIIVGIGCGNAAFEMGNILGAAVALADLSSLPASSWVLVIGGLTFFLLWSGAYAPLEHMLILLVVIMSSVFLLTASLVQPSLSDIHSGFFTLTMPPGSFLTVMALIGTTVVPYNLFLHASAVQIKWPVTDLSRQTLRAARTDSLVSISLGGLLTVAILTTAASTFFMQGIPLKNAAAMATQLEPLVGTSARLLFASGLFAAGLTSAITAPLAAAYATVGILGWSTSLKSRNFRLVWASIVLIGTGLAFFGTRPIHAILLAQAANAFLLPLLTGCLLFVMNQKSLLGSYTNGILANTLGGSVFLIVTSLGIFQLLRTLGIV